MLLCVSGFFVDSHPQINAYIFHFIVDTYRFVNIYRIEG